MNASDKQRRSYYRSAMICFICTAVCIGIDIRDFWYAGQIYFTWKTGVSFALYVLLILMGIRALHKARKRAD